MENRLFFPQSRLDEWIVDERVEWSPGQLIVVGEGRKYRLDEAVRVVREVTGAKDAAEVVGKVKAKADLVDLGAEVIEGSMLLGDNAYEVVEGWIAVPVGSLAQHLQARSATGQKVDCATEEELIQRSLLRKA